MKGFPHVSILLTRTHNWMSGVVINYFEDIKWVIRSRKWKKDQQYKYQRKIMMKGKANKIPQCLSNIKIVERDQNDTPTHKYMTANTQIHDH